MATSKEDTRGEMLIAEFHFVKCLLRVAIVATQGVGRNEMESRAHGFVVGDALRIVALDNAEQVLWEFDGLLLNNLVVANDAKSDIGCDNCQLIELVIREESVGNLDDTLSAHAFAAQVEANGHLTRQLFEVEETDNREDARTGDMIDDGAVLYGGYLEHFFFHNL